jgi:hypothetical protein
MLLSGLDWPLWKMVLFVWLSLAVVKSVITTGTLWQYTIAGQKAWQSTVLGTALASLLMCGLVTLFAPVLLLSQRQRFWRFPDRNLERLLSR